MNLSIHEKTVKLNGEDFYIASGDMHYFRCMPSGWKRRLELMKDFGLTAVQTYVPWHQHEPVQGQFNFDGHLNLSAFLALCAELDLKVLLRPSPYVTSELDLGGVPAWVLENEGTQIREPDPYYLECIGSYYKRLCKEFVPYLSTNGGPIIAVALENEYGSYANHKPYLHFLRDTLMENGVDVPFYTTDGAKLLNLVSGSAETAWSMVNCGEDVETAIANLRTFAPDKKAMIGEFWTGRHEMYGGSNTPREVAPLAAAYDKALRMDAFVNFYMFCGGTNFGFTSGMHYGIPFHVSRPAPHRMFAYATSYNCDALVTEWGDTTPKYYAMRRVLDAYLGKTVREDKIADLPKQIISNVKITRGANLLDSPECFMGRFVKTHRPCSMESLRQTFGYILYSTRIPEMPEEMACELFVDDMRDLSLVYVDGKFCGDYLRGEGEEGSITLHIPKKGCLLQILVENMGRPDAAKYVKERKGICGGVHIKGVHLSNWEITTIPMHSISSAIFTGCEKTDSPAFFHGSFRAEPGVDTFLDTKGLTKGFVCINGFNIGRYWNVGPQRTLYVPGELLKEENEIVVFEMYDATDSVCFIDKPMIDELDENNPFVERLDKMQ